MSDVKTVFGSLHDYQKGHIEVIADDPRNYVFSNVFEVAGKSRPWERVAVGKNFEYVVECLRAEGTSPWFCCGHDEFALVMDGRVEVRLMRPDVAPAFAEDAAGAIALPAEPQGRRMGTIRAGRGHMALLPARAAYQFHSESPGVLVVQTIQGALTIERWAEICLK